MDKTNFSKMPDGHNKYKLTVETTVDKDIKKGEKIKITIEDNNGKVITKIKRFANKAKYFFNK